MSDLSTIFSSSTPTYQRPEDLDFPVSKIRLFMDVLWQAITQKPLTDDQRTTLKQLIDLLNLLDEHKHESQKELIAAMLPSISPLLEKMPTLGLTGTHVFTHLVPIYQLYLPSIELMVKDAHPFTLEETLLYYELTIFDHLFLVHIFEQEHELNMIELLLTIKAIILINALVYDYQQHNQGRSISFFTFLMRGGKNAAELEPFLMEVINHVCDEVKLTVTNTACLETLEFLKTKLLDTTHAQPTKTEGVQTEQAALTDAFAPTAAPGKVDEIFNQATDTPIEPTIPVETTPVTPVTAQPETPATEAVSAVPEIITPPTITEPMTPPPEIPAPVVESPIVPSEPIAPMPAPIPTVPEPTAMPEPQPVVAVNPVVSLTPETPITPESVMPTETAPVIPPVETPIVEAAPISSSPLAENPVLAADPTATPAPQTTPGA